MQCLPLKESDASPHVADLPDGQSETDNLTREDAVFQECKGEEVISPLTGQCAIIPTFYVADYPDMCPMDVGCLPIEQMPEGTPDDLVIPHREPVPDDANDGEVVTEEGRQVDE